MNKVFLTGRLTKDVDVKYTQNQKAIVRFTLAVDRRSKEKEADFISCMAWEHIAELMGKYLAKGSKISVIGHIQTGSYDGQNGKVYTTDVVVDELEFLDPKKDETKPDDSDELPF